MGSILIQWLEKIAWPSWGDIGIWSLQSLQRKHVLACWWTLLDIEQDTGLWGLGMFCVGPFEGQNLLPYIGSCGAVVALAEVWSKGYNTQWFCWYLQMMFKASSRDGNQQTMALDLKARSLCLCPWDTLWPWISPCHFILLSFSHLLRALFRRFLLILPKGHLISIDPNWSLGIGMWQGLEGSHTGKRPGMVLVWNKLFDACGHVLKPWDWSQPHNLQGPARNEM